MSIEKIYHLTLMKKSQQNTLMVNMAKLILINVSLNNYSETINNFY